MAEYIERQALIELLQVCAADHYSAAVNNAIMGMPAADVVPVVRCKDCKHMMKTTKGRFCFVWYAYNGAGDDGLCNYWEKRTEDGD